MDLKVLCFVGLLSKFVSNFEVYCGKNSVVEEAHAPCEGVCRESKLAHNAVLCLLFPNMGKSHVLTQFFSSIVLFKELLNRRMYAICTIWCNRVGIWDVLKNIKAFNKHAQKILDCRMQ